GICGVQEDDWSPLIGKNEPAELVRIKLSPGIAAYDAISHNEHAGRFNRLGHASESVLPGGWLAHGAEQVLHHCGRDARGSARGEGRHETRSVRQLGLGITAVPILAELTGVDGVEEVAAWGVHTSPLGERKSRSGSDSAGGESRKREPKGTLVARENSSSCLMVGLTAPVSHAPRSRNLRCNFSRGTPPRFRAQSNNSRFTLARADAIAISWYGLRRAMRIPVQLPGV